MKSFNVDVLQAVSTLVEAGEITIADLNEAIAAKRGLNQPCGFAADFHGHFFSIFIATDKEDRNKVSRSKDGTRIKFNLRANDVKKKTQEAQTPGQVLPQGVQGVPAESLVLLQQILTQAGLTAAPAADAPASEADFGDLNKTLKL